MGTPRFRRRADLPRTWLLTGQPTVAQRKDSLQRSLGTAHTADDWQHAELHVDLQIQSDLSVTAAWRARLHEDDDEWLQTGEVLVPARKTAADPPAPGPAARTGTAVQRRALRSWTPIEASSPVFRKLDSDLLRHS